MRREESARREGRAVGGRWASWEEQGGGGRQADIELSVKAGKVTAKVRNI